MIHGAGILVVTILAGLSALHLYWAFGGKWGMTVVIPTVGGNRAFNPSSLATVLVAAALLLAVLVITGRMRYWGTSLPKWIFTWGTWGIALVFLLRAVGDFRLAGFFKQIHQTDFAYWDTWLFSPLCLLLSVLLCLLSLGDDAG